MVGNAEKREFHGMGGKRGYQTRIEMEINARNTGGTLKGEIFIAGARITISIRAHTHVVHTQRIYSASFDFT